MTVVVRGCTECSPSARSIGVRLGPMAKSILGALRNFADQGNGLKLEYQYNLECDDRGQVLEWHLVALFRVKRVTRPTKSFPFVDSLKRYVLLLCLPEICRHCVSFK
jgi:hypothetical protein